MKKFKFLVALTTRNNDYQLAQEVTAQETARRLGVDIEIIDANNDPIDQSQQLLQSIQSITGRPDAIIVEPLGGTTLPVVARGAADAGIGWAGLNPGIDFAPQIPRRPTVPVLLLTSQHYRDGP